MLCYVMLCYPRGCPFSKNSLHTVGPWGELMLCHPLMFMFLFKFSAISFKGQSPLQPRIQEHPDFRVCGIFIGRIRDWKCRGSLSTTELKEHLVWTYSTLVSDFKCLVRWTKLFWIDVFLYKNKTSQGTLIIFLSFKLY